MGGRAGDVEGGAEDVERQVWNKEGGAEELMIQRAGDQGRESEENGNFAGIYTLE